MVTEQFSSTDPEVIPSEQFRIDGLSYRYPHTNQLSLDGIAFTLHQGEMVGLHGPSGSGKTTLLYTMSGLIPHFFKGGEYSGDVTFNGTSVGNHAMRSAMQDIAFISQNPQEQLFGKNVEDAIAFGMENRSTLTQEMVERIQEMADRLHLSHLIGRDVRTLSGGEAQATLIAAMLSTKPSVLLLDEVISALDPAAVQRVTTLLGELHEDGLTVVLSDSDSEWIKRTAPRTIVLEEGKVIFDGSSGEPLFDCAGGEQSGMGYEYDHASREKQSETAIAVFEQVSFGYGAENVLEQVSLHIPEDMCTAVIGHNGSGKSTVGKLLAGFEAPRSGKVIVNGKEVNKLPASEAVREVSYLFQRPSLMFSEQTVVDEFLLSSRELGIEPAVTLAEFALAGVENVSPHELSSGQQQRLATAATFSINPHLLILDEPTRGQSRQDRDRLTAQIEQRSDSGRATMLITHDMQLAMAAADHVIVMDHGEVLRQGQAEQIFADQALFEQLGFRLPSLRGGTNE